MVRYSPLTPRWHYPCVKLSPLSPFSHHQSFDLPALYDVEVIGVGSAVVPSIMTEALGRPGIYCSKNGWGGKSRPSCPWRTIPHRNRYAADLVPVMARICLIANFSSSFSFLEVIYV